MSAPSPWVSKSTSGECGTDDGAFEGVNSRTDTTLRKRTLLLVLCFGLFGLGVDPAVGEDKKPRPRDGVAVEAKLLLPVPVLPSGILSIFRPV